MKTRALVNRENKGIGSGVQAVLLYRGRVGGDTVQEVQASTNPYLMFAANARSCRRDVGMAVNCWWVVPLRLRDRTAPSSDSEISIRFAFYCALVPIFECVSPGRGENDARGMQKKH